jgi:hypothetical protein
LSPQTKGLYRYVVEKYVLPGVGQLRLNEATTGVVDAFLKATTRNAGPRTAKSARAVLSGMFGLATRLDVIASNPVRQTAKITDHEKQAGKKTGLTAESLSPLWKALRQDETALAYDLPT